MRFKNATFQTILFQKFKTVISLIIKINAIRGLLGGKDRQKND